MKIQSKKFDATVLSKAKNTARFTFGNALIALLLTALVTSTAGKAAIIVGSEEIVAVRAFGDDSETTKMGTLTMTPFVSVRKLPDGETETRLHYGGISAKETSAVSSGQKNRKVGMHLLQITDGRHFVQAVYDADFTAMKDCEYVRDVDAVAEFLAGFVEDATTAERLQPAAGNVSSTVAGTTVQLLERADVRRGLYRKIADYRGVRAECKRLHRRMKVAKSASQVRKNLGTDRRSKRELFIYPDTNWCGVGASTEGFNDLGLNAAADRCCRQHDHCPYMIEGFTTKYNLFNYRFHTLSHCECDERFRTCLKMVDNGISNLVGKLFFNIVQMKCFVLKSEKTCVKRSWWGRCIKHEKQVTAHMKDVMAY